ncbi:ABC transporter permease [Lederbergia citrea]|uniref:ABC transporter permease n=1 Tax=Lederbergia citrea TaxID=2833581 RepID=UPI001BC8E241|nr:FtsX-like permease family protein [Lederbergia citrea]MBS4206124.1 ABC transporter permease [Lederbergia citrea]
MTFKDQFSFVRQNTKKNKTRLFMTILATAIGCTFLIVLASVGFGLHKSIIGEMMENRLVTEVTLYGKTDDKGAFHELTDTDIEYFETIENVKAVTRRQTLQQWPEFQLDDYKINSNTLVTYFPEEIKAGFELSKGRLPEKDNEIVVGSAFPETISKDLSKVDEPYNEDGTLKEEYAYKGELIDQTINMQVIKMEDGKEVKKAIPLTIVGIAKAPSREWLKITDVFISEAVLKQVEAYTGTRGGSLEPGGEANEPKTERTYDNVNLYADNVKSVAAISEQLKKDQYAAHSIADELKQINMIFTIMKVGLIFIGTIALIIASIGIYNTMTMAVTERAPDIGIMKAIGANPKTIKNIFLLESSYIGFLGALIGTVVAYGISYIVNLALPLVLTAVFEETPPKGLVLSHIPWSLTLISVSICLIVTLFSGWRPAERATRVDVLKAMRREV